MLSKLRLNVIFEDFSNKVYLSEEQKKILKMLIDRETTVKISMTIGISQRTLGSEIHKLKKLYKDYLKLEKTKLEVLLTE